MSEEKCKYYSSKSFYNSEGECSKGYSKKMCANVTNCYYKQLQTAKEELQAYKEDRFCQDGCTVYQFDKIKQLKEENEKLRNLLGKPYKRRIDLENNKLTQQNKQMREALEKIADFNNTKLSEISNIAQQALKEVNNEK